MRRMALVAVVLLASTTLLKGAEPWPSPYMAESMVQMSIAWPGPFVPQPSAGPIALDGSNHCAQDNGGTSSSTVSCTLGNVTAGDAITVEWKFGYGSGSDYPIYITDSVNSGRYEPLMATYSDYSYWYGTAYIENSAAGSITVTLTASHAEAYGAISVEAWKGVASSYVVDSNQILSQHTTASNPTSGTAITPTSAGEAIIGSLSDSSTPTAGTNYALIDTNTTSKLWPEYWIETSPTSTNTPYTASSAAYYDQMEGIAPNLGGTCGATTILDWAGGTNGNTVTTGTLGGTSQHGNAPQPNGNYSHSPSSNIGAWVLTGAATGMTFGTDAYQPFANSIKCPFYSGSGTTTSAVGVDYSTTQSAHSASLYFETLQPNVTAATCFNTTVTGATGDGTDVFTLYGDVYYDDANNDYANVNMKGDGSGHLFMYMEAKAGNSCSTCSLGQAGTVTVSSFPVWILIKYIYQGDHTLSVYSGCGSNPSLIGTVTAPGGISGGSYANRLLIGSAGAVTSQSGKLIQYGAIKLDYLHGSTLLP